MTVQSVNMAQTGTNNLMSAIAEQGTMNIKPEVGMGVTLNYYTDRKAYTIIEVISEEKIRVQQDIATRTDKNGMDENQSYNYERNPNGATAIFTKRKNGRWVRQGEGMRKGLGLSLGVRQEYYDYSF